MIEKSIQVNWENFEKVHIYNINPTLHKLLAHSEELVREINFGYGFKCFSEEGSEQARIKDLLGGGNQYNFGRFSNRFLLKFVVVIETSIVK